MTERFSITDYVSDERFQTNYYEHQQRFADRPRDTDKVFIRLVRDIIQSHLPEVEHPKLLDIGCSAGNLLGHLKHAFPSLELTGGDLVTDILEKNRANPRLSGIDFKEMSVLELDSTEAYHIVTVSAVLFMLNDAEFARAIQQISKSLVPGGWFLAFDFVHPYDQDLEIIEKTESHRDGLVLYFRREPAVREVLTTHGFQTVSIEPFSISIDMPRSEGKWDMKSHTVMTEDGERLIFRGALSQPWCHIVAQRAG